MLHMLLLLLLLLLLLAVVVVARAHIHTRCLLLRLSGTVDPSPLDRRRCGSTHTLHIYICSCSGPRTGGIALARSELRLMGGGGCRPLTPPTGLEPRSTTACASS